MSAWGVFSGLFSARKPGRVRGCRDGWLVRCPGCAARARGHDAEAAREAGRCAVRGRVQRTESVARRAPRGPPARAGWRNASGRQWRREGGGGEMTRKACEVHGRRAAVAPSVFFTASGFFERDRKKDWAVIWECNGKV